MKKKKKKVSLSDLILFLKGKLSSPNGFFFFLSFLSLISLNFFITELSSLSKNNSPQNLYIAEVGATPLISNGDFEGSTKQITIPLPAGGSCPVSSEVLGISTESQLAANPPRLLDIFKRGSVAPSRPPPDDTGKDQEDTKPVTPVTKPATPAPVSCNLGTIGNSWTRVGNTTKYQHFEVSSTKIKSGAKSQKILAEASGIGIQQTITLDPTKQYTISTWVFVEKGQAELKVTDSSNKSQSIKSTKTGEWQELKTRVDFVSSIDIKISSSTSNTSLFTDAITVESTLFLGDGFDPTAGPGLDNDCPSCPTSYAQGGEAGAAYVPYPSNSKTKFRPVIFLAKEFHSYDSIFSSSVGARMMDSLSWYRNQVSGFSFKYETPVVVKDSFSISSCKGDEDCLLLLKIKAVENIDRSDPLASYVLFVPGVSTEAYSVGSGGGSRAGDILISGAYVPGSESQELASQLNGHTASDQAFAISHEMGHTMGLLHSHRPSVMSYYEEGTAAILFDDSYPEKYVVCMSSMNTGNKSGCPNYVHTVFKRMKRVDIVGKTTCKNASLIPSSGIATTISIYESGDYKTWTLYSSDSVTLSETGTADSKIFSISHEFDVSGWRYRFYIAPDNPGTVPDDTGWNTYTFVDKGVSVDICREYGLGCWDAYSGLVSFAILPDSLCISPPSEQIVGLDFGGVLKEFDGSFEPEADILIRIVPSTGGGMEFPALTGVNGDWRTRIALSIPEPVETNLFEHYFPISLFFRRKGESAGVSFQLDKVSLAHISGSDYNLLVKNNALGCNPSCNSKSLNYTLPSPVPSGNASLSGMLSVSGVPVSSGGSVLFGEKSTGSYVETAVGPSGIFHFDYPLSSTDYAKTYRIIFAKRENGLEQVYETDFRFINTSDRSRDCKLLYNGSNVIKARSNLSFDFDNGLVGEASVPLTFSADSYRVVQNGSATFRWGASEALHVLQGCSASGGWEGAKPAAGSERKAITDSKNYALSCTNGTEGATRSFRIEVAGSATPTLSLTSDKTNLVVGESTTIRWSSANATSCRSYGDYWRNEERGTSGSTNTGAFALAGSYAYDMVCTASDGVTSVSKYVRIEVSAPVIPQATISGLVGCQYSGSPTDIGEVYAIDNTGVEIAHGAIGSDGRYSLNYAFKTKAQDPNVNYAIRPGKTTEAQGVCISSNTVEYGQFEDRDHNGTIDTLCSRYRDGDNPGCEPTNDDNGIEFGFLNCSLSRGQSCNPASDTTAKICNTNEGYNWPKLEVPPTATKVTGSDSKDYLKLCIFGEAGSGKGFLIYGPDKDVQFNETSGNTGKPANFDFQTDKNDGGGLMAWTCTKTGEAGTRTVASATAPNAILLSTLSSGSNTFAIFPDIKTGKTPWQKKDCQTKVNYTNLLPNLSMFSIRVSPSSSIEVGTSHSVMATIQNDSSLGISQTFDVAVYLDKMEQGSIKGYQTVSSLKAGGFSEVEFANLTLSGASSLGNHTYFVCADWNNLITESDEKDNCMSTNLTITACTDTSAPVVASATPPAGGATLCTNDTTPSWSWIVSNQGCYTLSRTELDTSWDSNNAVFNSPISSFTQSSLYPLKPDGNYSIKVRMQEASSTNPALTSWGPWSGSMVYSIDTSTPAVASVTSSSLTCSSAGGANGSLVLKWTVADTGCGSSQILNWIAVDSTAGAAYYTDWSSSKSFSETVENLSPGAHYVTIKPMDKANNISPSAYKRYDFNIPTCSAPERVVNSILRGVAKIFKVR
ncbi:hypothetical protein L6255_03420 [Candidatus Parcubacteria bacterium]|nr:hypothetical protein [Patescibacteria group bacterium]MCG2689460.1 hypothetical protein [Candidatus Parcubacteria bacterium]